jgi:HrpA-like RNA helicase
MTDLGRICSNLPLDMPFAKLCLYGLDYGVFEECITVACIMQSQKAFFAPLTRNQSIQNCISIFNSNNWKSISTTFNSMTRVRRAIT